MYKDIGQNFLINKNIIKKIINIVKPKKKQTFLEIGCGTGLLTKELYKYTKKIIAIDIDNKLIKFCKKKYKNIKFIKKDILKFNFLNYKKKLRIIGNIPYYISHKIIYKLIKNYKFINDIHILVQKEFANNLIQKIKNKKYSKTTLIINSLFKIKKIMNIKNYFFKPKPKIESTLIKLISNKNKNNIKDINFFIHITNNIFYKKNRKIYNNLKNFINIKELIKHNINPNNRLNKINIKKYYNIVNYIIKKNKNF